MTSRIAILTGRSDPLRTGLSVEQRAFLQTVAPPWLEPLDQGFPYKAESPPERHVPLPLAAGRNASTWLRARFSPRFRDYAGAALTRLEALSVEAIITGSCGLDILRASAIGTPFRIIALGPVCPPPAGQEITVIAGRHDYLSRLLRRRQADYLVPGGHMDYWTCPDTQGLVAKLLRRGQR